jgi:hypothetical protein
MHNIMKQPQSQCYPIIPYVNVNKINDNLIPKNLLQHPKEKRYRFDKWRPCPHWLGQRIQTQFGKHTRLKQNLMTHFTN